MTDKVIVLNASEEVQSAVVETFRSGKKADFTIVETNLTFVKGENVPLSDEQVDSLGMFSKLEQAVITLSWGTKSAGFGEITLFQDENNKWLLDTECMSKEFVKNAFCHFIDSIEEE